MMDIMNTEKLMTGTNNNYIILKDVFDQIYDTNNKMSKEIYDFFQGFILTNSYFPYEKIASKKTDFFENYFIVTTDINIFFFGWGSQSYFNSFFKELYPYLNRNEFTVGSPIDKPFSVDKDFFSQDFEDDTRPSNFIFPCNNIDDNIFQDIIKEYRITSSTKNVGNDFIIVSTNKKNSGNIQIDLRYNFITCEGIMNILDILPDTNIGELNLCYQYPALTREEIKKIIKEIRKRKLKTKIYLSVNDFDTIINEVIRQQKNLNQTKNKKY